MILLTLIVITVSCMFKKKPSSPLYNLNKKEIDSLKERARPESIFDSKEFVLKDGVYMGVSPYPPSSADELFSRATDYLFFVQSKGFFPTFTGLCTHLGYTTSQFKRIKNDSESPIGRAAQLVVQIIAEKVEEAMLNNLISPKSATFWLQNIEDWKDEKNIINSSEKDASALLKRLKENSIEGELLPE